MIMLEKTKNKTKEREEKQMKNQKGITLIALIITIIVMLILVGVSVTVALEGGLFSQAKTAVDKTKENRDAELALDAGKVEINEKTYNSVEEYVNGGGSNQPTDPEQPSEPEIYRAYSIGEEVTIGEEHFFVIEESGTSKENVTLLAKYNLNEERTAQLTQSSSSWSAGITSFSSTNYWSDKTQYPLDLNEIEVPEGVTSIITIAKTYGANLGGEGRLIKKEETDILVTNYEDIMYGPYTSSGRILFWTSSAVDSENVWGLNYRNEFGFWF